jgi:hypothetical protein
MGRNDAENGMIEGVVQAGEATLRWSGGPSPLAAVVGECSDELLARAGQVLLRYTKAPVGEEAELDGWVDSRELKFSTLNSLDEAAVEALRL